VCVHLKEKLKKKDFMDIDMCPLSEGDRIILLYTNSLKQSFFFSSIFHKLWF
jgi:hypothetical protein